MPNAGSAFKKERVNQVNCQIQSSLKKALFSGSFLAGHFTAATSLDELIVMSQEEEPVEMAEAIENSVNTLA